MKNVLFYTLSLLVLTLSACSGSRTLRTDAVDVADSANQTHSGQPGYDKASAGFLVDMTDARLMDIKEGRAAAKKGSTPEIRNYGRLMIRDQNRLLAKMRKLGAAQKITLPADISNSKKEGFSQLAELSGSDFDSKFIRMITIDHERDVSEFGKAKDLGNKAIAAFATENLPVIQSHLDKINAIRDSRKN